MKKLISISIIPQPIGEIGMREFNSLMDQAEYQRNMAECAPDLFNSLAEFVDTTAIMSDKVPPILRAKLIACRADAIATLKKARGYDGYKNLVEKKRRKK